MSTTVNSEQFIKATPAQVYYALTHAAALHEWLCNFATVAPRPSGRMYLWWHGDFYSAGEYIGPEEHLNTFLNRADQNMYRIKLAGRNQVTTD